MHHQDIRQLRHDGDRHELSGIKAELGKEALADHQRSLRRGQERVAVGLGAVDELGAEVLRRARAVLDHHRLAEFRGELLRQDARHQIAVGAGRQRHHDADRAGRIGLRRGEAGARHKHQSERDNSALHCHLHLLPEFIAA